MATRTIDGKPVEHYFGRVTGTIDIDDVQADDIIMAVVVIKVGDPAYKTTAKGVTVGTYPLGVQDIAIVDDEIMRKQLLHHLPHLEQFVVTDTVFDGDRRRAETSEHEETIETKVTSDPEEEYVDLSDSTVSVESMSPDDVLVHDAEDGELFSPSDESRERGRLISQARDPILARFLNGD